MSAPTSYPVEFLTARDILTGNFPDVAESNKHSSGTGLHRIDFIGDMEPWNSFQDEVRKFDTSVPWGKYTTPMAARLKKGDDVNYSEFFLCGAEISSSGRYVTHVLNPVGGVAKKLGYGFRFSDWTAAGKMLQWPLNFVEAEKQTKEKRSIPDYALYCPSSSQTRSLGEAKHPWVNRPDLMVKYARQGQKEYVDQLRRFFGQVSRDMWAANLKLGFVTNYKWTIFLRREKTDGKWKLFYSDAISHMAKYTDGGDVSVRLCMMYLVHTISGEASAWSLINEEREPLSDWVEIPTTPTVTKTDSPTASQASQARVPEKPVQLPERPRNTNQAAEPPKQAIEKGKSRAKASQIEKAHPPDDKAKATEKAENIIPGKNTAAGSAAPGTSPQTSSQSSQSKFTDVVVQWNKKRDGYTYAIGDPTNPANYTVESPSKWQELPGSPGKIFKLSTKPWLRSDKPS